LKEQINEKKEKPTLKMKDHSSVAISRTEAAALRERRQRNHHSTKIKMAYWKKGGGVRTGKCSDWGRANSHSKKGRKVPTTGKSEPERTATQRGNRGRERMSGQGGRRGLSCRSTRGRGQS